MNKSFTLIELLIVLVIIGVVAVLAIPKYEAYVNKARGAEAKTVLRSLADSLWRYHVETGSWPTTEEGFSKLDTKPPVSRYFDFSYAQYETPEFKRLHAVMKNKFLRPPVTNSTYTLVYTTIESAARKYNGNNVNEKYYVYYTYEEECACGNRRDVYLYDWDGNLIDHYVGMVQF